MTYELFKIKNNKNKQQKQSSGGRLIDVSLGSNTCKLELDNDTLDTTIDCVVRSIFSGSGYITNPSSLTNYNFKKYFSNTRKHKEIIQEKKRSVLDIEKVSKLTREKLLTCSKSLLYHGSVKGINGNINCHRNKGLCDFGDGFYTGECLEQAENRVSNHKSPIVYAYTYDFSGYTTYIFTDITLWALYVGYNRKVITEIPPKLLQQFNFINNHDIVIGYIADDKIAQSYNDFLIGNITNECLAECLKLVKYGRQFVFKNDKVANNCLKKYTEYILTPSMCNDSKLWSKALKNSMDKDIDTIKIQYRRKGKFIDECLEEYN